jgi:hypothetical protein
MKSAIELAKNPNWEYQPGMVILQPNYGCPKVLLVRREGDFWLTHDLASGASMRIPLSYMKDVSKVLPDITHPSTKGWITEFEASNKL